MKKTALHLLVLMTVCVQGFAQTGLDTVFGRYPYYYYNFFDDNWNISTLYPGTFGTWTSLGLDIYMLDTSSSCFNQFFNRRKPFKECAVRINSDTTLAIIGIAAPRFSFFRNRNPDVQAENDEAFELGYVNGTYDYVTDDITYTLDTNNLRRLDYHFNIYDTNMNIIASISKGYFDLPAARYIPGGCDGVEYIVPIPYYCRSYEAFFDTPIYINGPFYISQTLTRNDSALFTTASMLFENPHLNCDYFVDSVFPYHYPSETLRYRDTLYTGRWQDDYTFSKKISNIFPIIRLPQDTCPQVRDIELFPSGTGHAFLRWARGSNHQGWQVSYGPAGTEPDDGTLLDFTSPITSVIAFDPDSHYVAYVRARCHFARDEWGPWSDSVSIWLGAPNSVDAAALAGSITLAPNPASDEVVIDSPVPVSAIEAFDARGACIHRTSQPSTNHYTLNTQHWPSGQYVVIIETPAGRTAKRMTVVR